jgi:hypothetical protein
MSKLAKINQVIEEAVEFKKSTAGYSDYESDIMSVADALAAMNHLVRKGFKIRELGDDQDTAPGDFERRLAKRQDMDIVKPGYEGAYGETCGAINITGKDEVFFHGDKIIVDALKDLKAATAAPAEDDLDAPVFKSISQMKKRIDTKPASFKADFYEEIFDKLAQLTAEMPSGQVKLTNFIKEIRKEYKV